MKRQEIEQHPRFAGYAGTSIDELIETLQKIRAEAGNLEVRVNGHCVRCMVDLRPVSNIEVKPSQELFYKWRGLSKLDIATGKTETISSIVNADEAVWVVVL